MRRLKYAINNLVDVDTLIDVYSEDDVYVMDNLYNGRPSKPYRSTDIGAIGFPEWICVTFPAPRMISLVALFNHNLTRLEGVGDELRFKGCNLGCESPECDWDAGAGLHEVDISGSLIEVEKGGRPTFENLYFRTKMREPNYRLDIIDQNNPDGHIEIGEYFLGNWEDFSMNCFLQPGRPDSPMYFKGDQQTFMGQDWMSYYSKAKEMTLTFVNISTPDQVNEIETFLDRVHENGGRVVIIPDRDSRFCFLMKIEDTSGFGLRTLYGEDGERKTWTIPMKALTTGVMLL
ncbi:unnamed protein product [marine sediment metagenome]|uniref:Uncharacterized protein n=1 Tax=marine sediment metagenome TaxID=412755 RepID=X0YTY4_9ZZZZ